MTYMRHQGTYYQYDPRLRLLENTVDRPAAEDMETPLHKDGCPNVQKSFINQGSCRIARGCEPLAFSDQPVYLNETTLQAFYAAGATYVFAVDHLRIEATYDHYYKSPCQETRSRWRQTPGACDGGETTLGATSRTILVDAIEGSSDAFNPNVRDISLDGTQRNDCWADSGTDAIEAKIEINGTCWQHVHPDTLNVYDFSVWKVEHPGNTPTFNPFDNMAREGTTIANFPASHAMSRWRNLAGGVLKNAKVGRLGDVLPFDELPSSVQTVGFAEAMGELVDDTTTHALVEVCGSPGEVANKPALDHRMTMAYINEFGRENWGNTALMPNRPMSYNAASGTIHLMINLYAPDQLLQRLAFALSQIWVVASGDRWARETEKWTTYYDIMLRHANGNLRDLMREVSYSPVMGAWLTFLQSQSLAYSGTKPDENYAREIMQLFTIGLWELNADGTRKRDAAGSPIQTYTNEHIVAFARAWTGFDTPLERGNLGRHSRKHVDPMPLFGNRRDLLPKMNLYSGHLGDHYPPCNALPSRAYLRAGARFTYIGTSPKAKWTDVYTWNLELNKGLATYAPQQNTSALYAKLCDPDATAGPTGRCQLKPEVVLDQDLDCDPYSTECSINEPTIVAIGPPGHADRQHAKGRHDRRRLAPSLPGGVHERRGLRERPHVLDALVQRRRRPAGLLRGGAAHVGLVELLLRSELGRRARPRPAARRLLRVPPPAVRLLPLFRGRQGDPDLPVGQRQADDDLRGPDHRGGRGVVLHQPRPPLGHARQRGVRLQQRARGLCHRAVALRDPAERRDAAVAAAAAVAEPPGAGDSAAPYPPPAPAAPPGPLLCARYSYLVYTYPSWKTGGTPYPDKPGYYDTVGAGSCRTHQAYQFQWTSDDCAVRVQIGTDGMVNLVSGGPTFYANYAKRLPYTDIGNGNLFHVMWSDGAYPTAATNCSAMGGGGGGGGGGGVCTVHGTDCVCDTQTVTAPVFTDVDNLPTLAEVEAKLMIGAPEPSAYGTGSGSYHKCVTAACNAMQGVTVWTTGYYPAYPVLDENAIFEITVNGSRPRYLANKASTVHVLGGAYTFRNPPMFMDMTHPTRRDAAYETEALLDHLFYHENTAPFTATRLIQNLVTSNPSPRYVAAVTTAFKTGSYGGLPFSGKYGDLAATAAAILLDREARSLVLQHDPSFGSVRDPIQKMYHLMRAMELVPSEGAEAQLDPYTFKDVGMEPYRAPSVFNFFLPQFVPQGVATSAQLWAPAAQLGIAPYVLNFQSAITSTIREGMNSCYDLGFGYGWGCGRGPRLMWTPQNMSDGPATIGQLSLLLTGGRLDASRRERILAKYEAARSQTGPLEAVRVAQQLIAASPEFHTNTQPQTKPKPAATLPPQASLGRPYKAIVVLYLAGGADTFNMVVPHSGCGNGSVTSYDQYAATRTGAALPLASLLPIGVPNGTQPCSTFGLHEKLPFVQQLFEEGDASIFANIGNLVEPISGRAEYYSKTKEIPRSLYSHEHQQTASRTLHPQLTSAKGVLGRMADVMHAQSTPSSPPFKLGAYSVTTNTEMMRGDVRPPLTLDKDAGVVQYYEPKRSIGASPTSFYSVGEATISALHEVIADHSDNVFAETANQLLRDALVDSEALGSILANTTSQLTQEWAQPRDGNDLADQLYQVARMIVARGQLQAERDIFYVDIGGWDMHSTIIEGMLTQAEKVDKALQVFVNEIKGQGVWDNVVVQTSSTLRDARLQRPRHRPLVGRQHVHLWRQGQGQADARPVPLARPQPPEHRRRAPRLGHPVDAVGGPLEPDRAVVRRGGGAAAGNDAQPAQLPGVDHPGDGRLFQAVRSEQPGGIQS